MKKKLAIFSLLSLLAQPVLAEEATDRNVSSQIDQKINEVIQKHQLEKQEFKPIIFDYEQKSNDAEAKDIDSIDLESNTEKDSRQKMISFKNELFQGVKLLIKSQEQEKILYLSPYEKIDSVLVDKADDYQIKVFDLDEKYLGNLIKADLNKKSLVQISPFLIFPDVIDKKITKKEPLKEETTTTRLNDPKKSSAPKAPTEKKAIEIAIKPKEVKIEKEVNPLEAENFSEAKVEEEKLERLGNELKVANISDYKVKISIKKANGESIGTNWTIENDAYTPELLKFAAKPVVLEEDTSIRVTYLDKNSVVKKEFELLAKEINKDENNDYIYFIENLQID